MPYLCTRVYLLTKILGLIAIMDFIFLINSGLMIMERGEKNYAVSFIRQILSAWLVMCVFSSCLTTKDITYFQPINQAMDEIVTTTKPLYTPVIKPGDILSITVNSLDKDDREIFNPLPASEAYHTQIGGFVVLQPVKGFTVDSVGKIDFPQVGIMSVAGLTTKEVELKLTRHLQEFVKSPTISVYIANYVISILGEVARPAQYVIPHNRITLPEALALAGDLTIYGNRKTVLIVREAKEERSFARVDLTNRKLFRSPYYYLHSGDLIIVEPTKGKLTSTDRIYQMSPIIISSLSLLLLTINTLLK